MKNKAKNQETPAMAELRGQGMTYRQIGDIYGVAPAAVGQRLRRMGIPPLESPTKHSLINKKRLILLYEVKRLSLERIAQSLKVTEGVIKKALQFHRIPNRPRLPTGGKNVDRLRKLIIGETVEIQCPVRFPRQVLDSAARSVGIKIFIRRVGSVRFQITRLDSSENRINAALARIDGKSLEEMYREQGLRIEQIADNLGVSIRRIRQALEFHAIEKRPRRWGSGKYTSVFKGMAVGESVELECPAKRPDINLHTIATRIGIKISLRKIAAGKFKIRRLK